MPRCLHTLTPEQQRGRSWTLQLTLEGDRVVRSDTVNGRGVMIEDSTRVASKSYRYDGERLVEIEARSRNGVVRSRARFDRDEERHFVTWFDDEGRPLPLAGTRAGGAVRTFDASGRVVELAYLDSEGFPAVNEESIAVVRKSYGANGRVSSEAYFSAFDAPMSTKSGVHEIRYEFDGWGERVSKRYFGVDGAPVADSRDGFHEHRHRRDALHNSIEWSYHDPSGARVICPLDGIAIGRFQLNEYGGEVRLDYFGLSGELTRSAYGYATRVKKLDASDDPIEWRHFDVAGAPVARNFGHSVLVATRDARGNVTQYRHFDAADRPVRTREGYAEARMTYDARDNCTSTAYFDENRLPVLNTSGYHQRTIQFDGDREVRAIYWDLHGNRVDTEQDYAERVTVYDDGGVVMRYRYFAADGFELTPLPRCTASFEPAQKAALTAGFSKLATCGPPAGSASLVFRIHFEDRGKAKTFAFVGTRPGEKTTECVRGLLDELRVPRPLSGCVNVTVEVSPATTAKVRVLTLGDENPPDPPPG
ncbi:MAG TPA: hypothetical protein VGK73_03775 [Polyangiaceae bacterium]